MNADERKARCAAIEVLVLDVDGVLTDGVIALDDRGIEHKHFHVRDGSALAFWRRAGWRAAILSGRRARCVDRRAAELGVAPVVQGRNDKQRAFEQLLQTLNVAPHQVCFMGDDLPDLPVLTAVGLAACPADAAPEVRAVAHIVTASPGGRGAVRELIETILRDQGRWAALVASYLPTAGPTLPASASPPSPSTPSSPRKLSTLHPPRPGPAPVDPPP